MKQTHRVVLLMVVLALLALSGAYAATNSGSEELVTITKITYSCGDVGVEAQVLEASGFVQGAASRLCTDEAVASAVARDYEFSHNKKLTQTTLQLVGLTSREISLTGSPLAWLGVHWWKLALGIFGAILLFNNIFVVRQQTVHIIERLGKYTRTATAGLNLKIPFIESAVQEFSLRQEQEPVEVDTKTSDNVFLKVGLAVQFRVVDPRKAFYELADFTTQLKSYVFDEVRAAIPSMKFDEVFQKKETLAEQVRRALTDKMDAFGYKIIDVLVTDITPPQEIQDAMNQVVTQSRLREAATEKGEAEKTLTVKAAEAQRDRDKLHGEGIAAFRKALAHGIKESMGEVKAGAPGLTDDQVSALLITTQYFDTLKDVAGRANSNTIFLPGGPEGGHEVFTQMTAALAATTRGKNGHDTTAGPALPAPSTPAAPAAS